MYSRKEEAAITKAFWTAFGRYMQPVPSATGDNINWVNYKSGIKYIYVKTDVNKSFALVSFDVSHQNNAIQEKYVQHLLKLRKNFEALAGKEFTWENRVEDGRFKVYKKLEGVNILEKNDWPGIISFLKQNLISIDAFWSDYRLIFEML